MHRYLVGVCGYTILSNDIRGGIKENLRGKCSSVSIDSSTGNGIPEKWIIWTRCVRSYVRLKQWYVFLLLTPKKFF